MAVAFQYGVAVFVVSFLLGSIPFGLIISKVFFHQDIRKTGSGNIGTTNAMRSMGKVGGGAVFLLDFGKGLLSGFIGLQVATACVTADASAVFFAFTAHEVVALSFMGCVLGHIYSPWLKFHGGKGIAVAVGCLFFAFGPIGALLNLMVFIVLVPLTRYVSVGSIASGVACPFFALYFYWGDPLGWLFMTIGAAAVVFAHRGNIKRLLDGTERRIGSSSDKQKRGAQ